MEKPLQLADFVETTVVLFSDRRCLSSNKITADKVRYPCSFCQEDTHSTGACFKLCRHTQSRIEELFMHNNICFYALNLATGWVITHTRRNADIKGVKNKFLQYFMIPTNTMKISPIQYQNPQQNRKEAAKVKSLHKTLSLHKVTRLR